MKGDVVYSPSGERVVLVDIGHHVLLDNATVRVWDVELDPGEVQPWHQHHNPYIVLSLQGSPGRMDWLDGSEPRYLDEYPGGAIYRPISPVHRLTNIGDRPYRNRLVELKDFGENLPEPADIGPGARSQAGQRPGGPAPDGRQPVLIHPHATVWDIEVDDGATAVLDLSGVPHLVARIDAPTLADDQAGGVAWHPAGEKARLGQGYYFVVELTYLEGHA